MGCGGRLYVRPARAGRPALSHGRAESATASVLSAGRDALASKARALLREINAQRPALAARGFEIGGLSIGIALVRTYLRTSRLRTVLQAIRGLSHVLAAEIQ